MGLSIVIKTANAFINVIELPKTFGCDDWIHVRLLREQAIWKNMAVVIHIKAMSYVWVLFVVNFISCFALILMGMLNIVYPI